MLNLAVSLLRLILMFLIRTWLRDPFLLVVYDRPLASLAALRPFLRRGRRVYPREQQQGPSFKESSM